MWTCNNCETRNSDSDFYCACCGAKKDSEYLTGDDNLKRIRLNTGVWSNRQEWQPAKKNNINRNLFDSQQTTTLPDEYHVPVALEAKTVPPPVVRNVLHYLTMLVASAFFILTPSGLMITVFLFFVPGLIFWAPLQTALVKYGVDLNALQMFVLFYGLLVIIVCVVSIAADRKEDKLGKQFRARIDGKYLVCSWPAQIISAGERWALSVDGNWIASGASGNTVGIPLSGNQTKRVTLAKFSCGKVEGGIPKEINNITWLSEAIL